MLDFPCPHCSTPLPDHAGTDAAPLCRQCAELVTEDWLEEIGFRRGELGYCPPSYLVWATDKNGGWVTLSARFHKGGTVEYCVNGLSLPRRAWPTTRAGVRELCRVLGVEVKR